MRKCLEQIFYLSGAHAFPPCRAYHSSPIACSCNFLRYGFLPIRLQYFIGVIVSVCVLVLNSFAYNVHARHFVGQSASRFRWPEPNKCISFDYDNEIDEHCMQISLSSSLAACCCWCCLCPKFVEFRNLGPGDKVEVEGGVGMYACTHYMSRIFRWC